MQIQCGHNYANRGGRGNDHRSCEGTRGTNDNRDNSHIQYYNCQGYGNYAPKCKKPRQERQQEANLSQGHINDKPTLLMAVIHDSEPRYEVLLNEENVNPILINTNEKEQNQSKMWYLDNSVSINMIGDKTKF